MTEVQLKICDALDSKLESLEAEVQQAYPFVAKAQQFHILFRYEVSNPSKWLHPGTIEDISEVAFKLLYHRAKKFQSLFAFDLESEQCKDVKEFCNEFARTELKDYLIRRCARATMQRALSVDFLSHAILFLTEKTEYILEEDECKAAIEWK